MSSYYETIRDHEVSFHPHSFADSDGRLFCWQGELYRGLRSGQAPFFLRLFEDGTVASLVGKGLLIDSDVAPLSVEGYAAVIRHRRVPFVSYPQEWCPAMLKDASLTLVDLAIELAGRNLTVKDAHPWNLLFDGCDPVFVDLTSITPARNGCDWPAYEEFCHFCYYPLILMSLGHERIARSLLPEYGGVRHGEVVALAQRSPLSAVVLSKLLRRGLKPMKRLFRKEAHGTVARLKFLRQVREDVEKIRLPAPTATTPGPTIAAGMREAVRRVLVDLRPASVLDFIAGDGWSSRLAAATGSRVVAASTDAAAIAGLYAEGRNQGLPILPLVLDFMKPTPSLGYANHYLMAATDRLAGDMVMALSLVRRAVFDFFLPFHLIVEGLASFSRRWAVVDFTPLEKGFAGADKADIFPWYSLENFVEALEKRFRRVEIIARDVGGSELLLCEK